MNAKAIFSYKGNSKPILYLIPTPVGNIQDIGERSKEILASSDLIACEDTRNTQMLLSRLNINNKNLIYCYSQTELQQAEKIISRMLTEKLIVSYCSDAGSPGISDPGGLLASLAIKNNIPVSAIPGPTAFVPALTASGFNSAQFTFIGFLPTKESNRIKTLEKYVQREETLIFYEAPHRLLDTLKSMEKIFGKDRRACLGREISKLYEQYIRGTLEEISTIEEDFIRGEFVIIIEGKKEEDTELSEEDLIKLLQEELKKDQSLNDIAKNISDTTGLRKNYLYKLLVKIKNDL